MYDCMDLTEELVSTLVKEMTGSYETTFTNQHGEVMNVNWAAPWRRVEMIPELERKSFWDADGVIPANADLQL